MRKGDTHLKKQERRKWGTYHAVFVRERLTKSELCRHFCRQKLGLVFVTLGSSRFLTPLKNCPVVGSVCEFKEVADRRTFKLLTTLHVLCTHRHQIQLFDSHMGSLPSLPPAWMLLHHKSVVKTSLCVAAPLVTWLALTFSIKYLPPRPTVAFSRAANQTQMDIYNWQQMERTSHTPSRASTL